MQQLSTAASAAAWILLVASAFGAGCESNDPPPAERTDDGLVRVPSRAVGGVYRDPDAVFTQYKRLILETPTVAFTENWRKTHKDVSDAVATRYRNEAVRLFREEFIQELVERGNYTLADAPDADVLIVNPRVVDLDIKAPDVGEPGDRSYSAGPIKMEVVGELLDAKSGKLVGRIIMFESQERYGFNELRISNRTQHAHEMRLAFAKWSKLVREALNVAKTRPE